MTELRYKFTRWALANVFMASPWPEVDQEIQQGGRRFYVIPQRDDFYPAVAVEKDNSAPYEESYSPIARFLSSVVWFSEGRAAVFSFGGSSRQPTPLAGFSRNRQDFKPYYKGKFRVSELPLLSDDVHLSLGFWREGCNLEFASPHYAVLSFFKIVERMFPNGKQREAFVERGLSALPTAPCHFREKALPEMAAIRSMGGDVGEYVYKSCRCAVAHASGNHSAANPDDTADELRLRRALPIIKILAYVCMINEMGIPEPRRFKIT